MKQSIAFVGLFIATCAFADEYPLDIEADLKAEYFVVERGGTDGQPTLLLKRVRPGGSSYSRRQFDCESRTSRYLGSAETLEGLVTASPDPEMVPVREGSIAEQILEHACESQDEPGGLSRAQ